MNKIYSYIDTSNSLTILPSISNCGRPFYCRSRFFLDIVELNHPRHSRLCKLLAIAGFTSIHATKARQPNPLFGH